MDNIVKPSQVRWDPGELDGITPTRDCLKRIRRDVSSLLKDPLPGIYCVPDDTIVTKCHALIVGPFDTPYEGGFFYFILNFPENYPMEPPRVKLWVYFVPLFGFRNDGPAPPIPPFISMTTGGGSVRFNPNLYANGKVCLSILGTWSGPSWDSIQTLGSVLLSIQVPHHKLRYYCT